MLVLLLILTLNDISTWRYGAFVDKGLSAAIESFGKPDISRSQTYQWNPSAKTDFRTVFIETNSEHMVLRVTIYPRSDESMSVTELLRMPEQFIFSSGIKHGLGSYFQAETKDRHMSLLFLCAADRDPILGSVTIKSTKSPD